MIRFYVASRRPTAPTTGRYNAEVIAANFHAGLACYSKNIEEVYFARTAGTPSDCAGRESRDGLQESPERIGGTLVHGYWPSPPTT